MVHPIFMAVAEEVVERRFAGKVSDPEVMAQLVTDAAERINEFVTASLMARLEELGLLEDFEFYMDSEDAKESQDPLYAEIVLARLIPDYFVWEREVLAEAIRRIGGTPVPFSDFFLAMGAMECLYEKDMLDVAGETRQAFLEGLVPRLRKWVLMDLTGRLTDSDNELLSNLMDEESASIWTVDAFLRKRLGNYDPLVEESMNKAKEAYVTG